MSPKENTKTTQKASTQVEPKILKGFRDFLPEEAIKRQYLKDKLREVFERYGYDPIETPALEYLEIFKGQIGEEEKLFYQWKDRGGRWVALRYDQTVPLCRVVAQYPDQITLPFKRYQIQLAWRAEKPQKGRYREFLQADADILGIKGPEADAEVIALSMDIYRHLGFREVRTLINDRSLFESIPYSAIASIDKLKKIGRLGVIEELQGKGFLEKKAKKYLQKVTQLKPNRSIEAIFSYLKAAGFPDAWYQFEPTLARSFSYSTGAIWEVEIPGFEAGSVLGGERYDQLVSTFSKKEIPGTGFGLGFDRTLEAMEQFNLVPTQKTNARVLVTIFSPEFLPQSIELTTKLRRVGINTDLYPDPETRLTKQIQYADQKGIPLVLILGPEEIKASQVTIRDLRSRAQKTVSHEEIVDLCTK